MDLISYHQDDTDYKPNNWKELSEWLISLIESEGSDPGDIEYIFCSDAKLLEVNRKYLDHDYYTDIITFPLSEEPLEASIFISIDRVRDNAHSFDNSFEDELHRVMAHGLLHMLGYNDTTEDAKKQMRKKENEYLTKRSWV